MMKWTVLIAVVFLATFFGACLSTEPTPVKELSTEEKVRANIEQLKAMATTGDLLVRLNDDVISDRVRYINEKDHSYSHTGLVVERNNQKYVAHISPEQAGADTLQYILIDSFINPAKHLRCALYRYELSEIERQNLATVIDEYKNANVVFDPVYELTTENKMYCSEMIYKALKKATGNRIVCRETKVPKNMQKAVVMFFKKENITPTQASTRNIMTIDNLYLRDDCTLLLEFPLQFFPDQVQ